MDGTELTHWRTACVSALAFQLLSSSQSKTLLLVRSSYLAPHLINAHLTTRPGVNRVIIWNRTEEKARQLANKLEDEVRFQGVVFESCGCLDDVVQVADIVSCATSAGVALVGGGGKLKKGAHLDLVWFLYACWDGVRRRGDQERQSFC